MKRTGCSLGPALALLGVLSLLVLSGCHRLAVPANAPSSKIALKSAHGRYLTAQGAGDDWSLTQNPGQEPTDCAWFTQLELPADSLGHRRVALQTCYGRYVTAPKKGSTRADWEVWQDSGPGDCANFIVEPHGDGIALRTCADKYVTAGDGNWDPPLRWGVVAETKELLAWEVFTVEKQGR